MSIVARTSVRASPRNSLRRLTSAAYTALRTLDNRFRTGAAGSAEPNFGCRSTTGAGSDAGTSVLRNDKLQSPVSTTEAQLRLRTVFFRVSFRVFVVRQRFLCCFQRHSGNSANPLMHQQCKQHDTVCSASVSDAAWVAPRFHSMTGRLRCMAKALRSLPPLCISDARDYGR